MREIFDDSDTSRNIGSEPRYFTKLGDKLVFRADDPNKLSELFISDGTRRGTRLLKNTRKTDGSYPFDLVALERRGLVVFSSVAAENGSELWVLEGSNTRLFADIDPGAGSSSPSDFVKLKDRLFFTASTPANGEELWVTDGTTVSLVKDIYPGVDDSEIERMTASGDYLFFVAEDGVHGEELWRTDGTEAGTVLVSDIYPGSSGSAITGLYPFRGGKVLFGARNAPNDSELWLGSVSGVSRIKDTNPTRSSGPAAFIKIPGKRRFYFRATTAEHGNELWVTNGKEEGTRLVADINPGTDPSLISEMTIFGDALVFAANDGRRGREPWIIRNP